MAIADSLPELLGGKVVAAGTPNAEIRTAPITPAYAKTHRAKLIDKLVIQKKIDRGIAARAVDKFIASGSAASKAPR